jgi:hypothetical protein
MRILKLAAAIGLMAGGLGLTSAASAQHRDVRIENRADYNRHVLGRADGRSDGPRHYNRSDRRDQRGYNHSNRRNCRTVWRHHRRERVCR